MGLPAKAVDTTAAVADKCSPGKKLIELASKGKAAASTAVSKASAKKQAGGQQAGCEVKGFAPGEHVKNSCN